MQNVHWYCRELGVELCAPRLFWRRSAFFLRPASDPSRDWYDMTEFADPADVPEPTLEMEFELELDEPLEPRTDGASLPLRN